MNELYYTVSQVAWEMTIRFGFQIRPRDVSDLLYNCRVPHELCPLVGGRRLIPTEALPLIEMVLREKESRPINTEEGE